MKILIANVRVLVSALAFALALLSSAITASAGDCAAEPFVKSAGSAFLSAARSGSPAAISGAVGRYSDLSGIAMFALGPYRKQLGNGDEAKYVSLTRGFIGRFIAKHSGKVGGGSLTVVSCSGSASAPLVTATAGGKRVIFKLSKTRNGYIVRDVNFASIWLAQQMRSTFTGVIRRNGGDIGALYSYLGS